MWTEHNSCGWFCCRAKPEQNKEFDAANRSFLRVKPVKEHVLENQGQSLSKEREVRERIISSWYDSK